MTIPIIIIVFVTRIHLAVSIPRSTIILKKVSPKIAPRIPNKAHIPRSTIPALSTDVATIVATLVTTLAAPVKNIKAKMYNIKE